MALAVVYSNFGGRIVHSRTSTGEKRDYVPDTLGSVSRMLGPGQTVINSYTYTPYGEVESFTGHRNPLEFVGTLGYYRDRFVGAITYVRARWYQASLSRWMTVDPRWPDESAYLYCDMSPATVVDPSGLRPNKSCFEEAFPKPPKPKDGPKISQCILNELKKCYPKCTPSQFKKAALKCLKRYGITIEQRSLNTLICCEHFGKKGRNGCTNTDDDWYNGCCHTYFCSCITSKMGDRWEWIASMVVPSQFWAACVCEAQQQCGSEYLGIPIDEWWGPR